MKDLEQLQKEITDLKNQLQLSENQLQLSENQLQVSEETITELQTEVKNLEALNNYYIEQLKLNRQKKFGASSEKSSYDSEQLSFFNEAEKNRDPLLPEPTKETIKVPKKKKSRKNTLENLETETITYDVDEKSCPNCDGTLHLMKQEVKNEIIIIPAKVKVIMHKQNIYACRKCEKQGIKGTIISAKAPKSLISKSLVSPSLMSHIMYQKYANAMPLDRQEKDFKRLGFNLSRQNMSNWVIRGAKLLEPLQAELKKELLKSDVLHADETTLEVLNEPGREATTNSYMWLYRTSGDAKKHVVLYDYTEGRGARFPLKYLEGFKGYLNCDGYKGYHKLEDQGVTLCGCWSHARRKFYEAGGKLKTKYENLDESTDESTDESDKKYTVLTTIDLSRSIPQVGFDYCNKLFELQRIKKNILTDKPDEMEKYLDKIKEQLKKLIDAFYFWVDESINKTLPKSLIGGALGYAQNQKKYLTAFLQDERIEISNNRAERGIKPFVIGRKNWLFSYSPAGAMSSAVIYSIIETAKEHNLNPFKYLNFCFEYIREYRNTNILNLLPWSEAAISASKN